MKKRHWIILIIIFICFDLIVFYILYSSSPVQNIPGVSPEQEKNETQTPWKFPKITFPWSSEGSEGEGAGGSGGGEGGEGSGGGGGGSEEPEPKIKVNYTLSIDSLPPALRVLTNYSVNDVILNVEQESPYLVEIESDTFACILLTQVSGSGVISYEVDNNTCEPSLCLGFMGCSIYMNMPHSSMVRFTPANVTG